jgi:hypothetical protein
MTPEGAKTPDKIYAEIEARWEMRTTQNRRKWRIRCMFLLMIAVPAIVFVVAAVLVKDDELPLALGGGFLLYIFLADVNAKLFKRWSLEDRYNQTGKGMEKSE